MRVGARFLHEKMVWEVIAAGSSILGDQSWYCCSDMGDLDFYTTSQIARFPEVLATSLDFRYVPRFVRA